MVVRVVPGRIDRGRDRELHGRRQVKRSPSAWREQLLPGELVKFSDEPQVYVVLRTFFSDRFLDNIVEVLTPDGKTHQFYEDYMDRVE